MSRFVLLAAFVLAAGAATAAPVARQQKIETATGETPAGVSQRTYARPVQDAAFAACEWVRVKGATGPRWRPVCG